MSKLLVCIWFFAQIGASLSQACSTFSFQDFHGQTFMSKSFDYYHGKGAVFINYRNMVKKSLTVNLTDTAHIWKSRFGSFTFSQVGKEFPYGGINEKGLAIEILWMDEAKYDAGESDKPTVNESQWIQFLLDTSATVDEAILNSSKVQVRGIFAKAHYMICDATSACAVVEFVNGKKEITSGQSLSVKALTNSIYQSPTPEDDRFLKLAVYLQTNSSDVKDPVAFGFLGLEKVEQPNWSRWQIVYNLSKPQIYFRLVGEKDPKHIDLSLFDFASCEAKDAYQDLESLPKNLTLGNMSLLDYSARVKLMDNLELPTTIKTLGAVYPTLFTRCE